MRHQVLLGVAGLCLCGGLGPAAQAAVDYHYRYVAGQPAYEVAPGGTVTVSLYLQETSDVVGSSLLADNGGLGQGALSVARSGGTAEISDAVLNGTFDLSFPDPLEFTASTADLWGMSFAGAPATDLGGGVSRVPIGTITIHGGPAGDISEFGIMPHSRGGASVTYGPQTYNLDDHNDPGNPGDAATLYTIASSSLFTVTTMVPEPVALSLLGVSCTLMLRRRQQP